jgi:hypothetical protein
MSAYVKMMTVCGLFGIRVYEESPDHFSEEKHGRSAEEVQERSVMG